MHREWNLLPVISRDWRSKLIDGVLAALVLYLTWLTLALSVGPLEANFGTPGLLVFVLGVMAVSLFSLQQSLDNHHSDPTRAWYGLAGGFLAWAVVSVSARFGLPVAKSSSLILIIMMALVVFLLWRVLPTGPRFYGLAFILNWFASILMHSQEVLAHFSPIFDLIYRATGYGSIFLALFVLFWILFLTKKRIQRISGALGLWFLISLALYVFRGFLF